MKITPINGNTETEGTECSYRGVMLLVARAGNVNFKKAFREKMKPFNDDLDRDEVPEETSKKIMIECAAETILVGWKPFTVDGEEYEYSVENAVELLTDDDDCYDAVAKHSNNIENYLLEKEENLEVK